MLRNLYLVSAILLSALCAIGQKSNAVKPAPGAIIQAPVIGEPVIVKSDTLFKLYTGQGLFEARERARVVSARIAEIISHFDFNSDSLKLKNDSTLSIISYKSELIMAVTNADAKFSELDRPHLATDYLSILKTRTGNEFESGTIKQTIINILEALAVVAILLLLIWAVNKGFRWLKLKILKGWEGRMAKLKEKGAPVGYANRLLPFLNSALKISRLLIIALLVYLALPVAFLIFPFTKPVATALLGYVLNPLKHILVAIAHYIPNLLKIVVIYIVTRYILKLIKFIVSEIENGSIAIKDFYPEWIKPTYNIIKVLLYAFMFVVIFPYLPGSDSKVFQGVTVFLGVLFSLGSSSAIANMVAGIVLTYMRPFKIGDRVKLGDITGDVVEKNMLVTRVRTIKNEDITVPNAAILSGASVNYTSLSKKTGLILHTSITIGYDAPWKIIHGLLIDAALATDGILAEPKPFVLQTDLNDFNVTYQINAYTVEPQSMAVIYSNMHQNIQDKFNEAGVEIMSPHYTALRDGNTIQIPDDYKPKGYKSPGFKMEGSRESPESQ